jgi:hypothetical protein
LKTLNNLQAFVQWYYGEGLTEDDFSEADEKLSNLIEKYEFLEKLPGYGVCQLILNYYFM